MKELSTDVKQHHTTFLDHKTKRDIIKPYRKYQMIILLLVIIMFILISILTSLNNKLSLHIKENNTLIDTYNEHVSTLEMFKIQDERIYVSYKHLYLLDAVLNSDIIRNFDELEMITSFISEEDSIVFSICYKATVEGDKASTFRENCSGVSPLLVLIETEHGYRFGGFTTRAFTSENEGDSYKEDDNAFVFSFDTQKKYQIEIPDKAISDVDGQFPIFGKNDIYIVDNFFTNGNSVTEYPKVYKEDPNAPGDYVLNGGIKKFKIKEMEVLSCYFNVNEYN
jgi:hypothetical protein